MRGGSAREGPRDQRLSAPAESSVGVANEAETDASNRWLALRLMMSSPTNVGKMVGLVQRVKGK